MAVYLANLRISAVCYREQTPGMPEATPKWKTGNNATLNLLYQLRVTWILTSAMSWLVSCR